MLFSFHLILNLPYANAYHKTNLVMHVYIKEYGLDNQNASAL